MKETWLIRHAESTANVGATTSSPATIPLTDRGVEQANCIAAYFQKQPDLVVTSPFLRAQQTAAPLLNRSPNVLSEQWDVQEFTYLSPERCHNTTFMQRKPMVAAYWARGEPDYCDGPGAESFAAFMLRVRATTQRITTQAPGFVAVFTHGQFIQAVMWLMWSNAKEINSESMTEFHGFLQALKVPNAAIVKIRVLPAENQLFFSGVITSHLPAGLITG